MIKKIFDAEINSPIPSAYWFGLSDAQRIEKINQLYEDGHTIKYFTARGMGRYNDDAQKARDKFYNLTKMQLELWGCKYHELIMGKPSADYYIDDKAIKDNDFFN
jgi:hypothetical protein